MDASEQPPPGRAAPASLAPMSRACALDANHMTHEGWLLEGQRYYWGWGEPVWACVHVRSLPNCLEMSYRLPSGETRRECLQIEFGPANYGVRPLFVCAGCDRSFYKLFLRDGLFRCKNCHRLKYPRASSGGDPDAKERAERRREMSGRALSALPGEAPPGTPAWAVGAVPAPEPLCCGARAEAARFKPGATEAVAPVHPAKLPGWRGGRPRLRVADVACTCGAGDVLDGHRSHCPKGRLIYQRRRRNQTLD